MILTPAQVITADQQIEAPLAGIITVGRHLLTNGARPELVEAWLTVEVTRDPAIELLAATAQECPTCYALHDETAWRIPTSDPAYTPTSYADDSYCSQACQDTAAERHDEDRAAWSRSEYAYPERGAA